MTDYVRLDADTLRPVNIVRRIDPLMALEWIVPPYHITPKAEHRRVSLPWPPSINHYKEPKRRGKRGMRLALSKRAQDYRWEAIHFIRRQLGAQYVREERPVALVATYLPKRELSDIDNFAKGPLDALTHANVYRDDSLVKRKISIVAPAGKSRDGAVDILIVPLTR